MEVSEFSMTIGSKRIAFIGQLGSCGAACATPQDHLALGLNVNANHLQSVSSGWITGTARPVQIGITSHLWRIEIRNDDGELVCVSEITMAIVKPKPQAS